MIASRETIYAAVFNILNGLVAFATRSRDLKHWVDVSANLQPAVYMNQTGESANTVTGSPTKWTLRLDVYIYARVQSDQNPGAVLNPLIDAVCNALNVVHPITGRTNLGIAGVEWVRVEGNIETDEGSLGEQAVAIIPVIIYAT